MIFIILKTVVVHEKVLAGMLPKTVTRKGTKKHEQIQYDIDFQAATCSASYLNQIRF